LFFWAITPISLYSLFLLLYFFHTTLFFYLLDSPPQPPLSLIYSCADLPSCSYFPRLSFGQPNPRCWADFLFPKFFLTVCFYPMFSKPPFLKIRRLDPQWPFAGLPRISPLLARPFPLSSPPPPFLNRTLSPRYSSGAVRWEISIISPLFFFHRVTPGPIGRLSPTPPVFVYFLSSRYFPHVFDQRYSKAISVCLFCLTLSPP